MTQFIRETGPKNLNRCTVSERKTGSRPQDDKTTSTQTERRSRQKAPPDNIQVQPNSTRALPKTNPTTRAAEPCSHAAPNYRRSPAPTPDHSIGGALLPRRTSLSAEPCSHAAPRSRRSPAPTPFISATQGGSASLRRSAHWTRKLSRGAKPE